MSIAATHFTDPSCPFAFSAEPHRRALRWTFGAGLTVDTRMVLLSRTQEEPLSKGLTPEVVAEHSRRLGETFGMPIEIGVLPRLVVSAVPCLAYVAARRHAPERAERLLRELRVAYFSRGELIDEDPVLAAVAQRAGVVPDDLRAWTAEPESAAELEADAAAARTPSDAARALDHKLGGPAEERRYTCPSYEFTTSSGATASVPGFQPLESYEVAIANLDPRLERRPEPDSTLDVLRWADEPLAAAEVAMVMRIDRGEAESRLREDGATPTDGYWTT